MSEYGFEELTDAIAGSTGGFLNQLAIQPGSEGYDYLCFDLTNAVAKEVYPLISQQQLGELINLQSSPNSAEQWIGQNDPKLIDVVEQMVDLHGIPRDEALIIMAGISWVCRTVPTINQYFIKQYGRLDPSK